MILRPRTLAVLLLALAAGLAWFFFRTNPAFDLDRFDENVSRLQRGYKMAQRVADLDAVPDWVRAEAAHLEQLEQLLAAGEDDCAKTAEDISRMRRDFLVEQAAMEGYLSTQEIDALPHAQSVQLAQKIIFVMAPAFASIQPQVHDWAEACPEESAVLYDILGMKRLEAQD